MATSQGDFEGEHKAVHQHTFPSPMKPLLLACLSSTLVPPVG